MALPGTTLFSASICWRPAIGSARDQTDHMRNHFFPEVWTHQSATGLTRIGYNWKHTVQSKPEIIFGYSDPSRKCQLVHKDNTNTYYIDSKQLQYTLELKIPNCGQLEQKIRNHLFEPKRLKIRI